MSVQAASQWLLCRAKTGMHAHAVDGSVCAQHPNAAGARREAVILPDLAAGRMCRFSDNGAVLAVLAPEGMRVDVFDVQTGLEADAIRGSASTAFQIADFCLSPSGRYLATFERAPGSKRIATDALVQPSDDTASSISSHVQSAPAFANNVKIWALSSGLPPAQLAMWTHKAAGTWTPQWTHDESFMAHLSPLAGSGSCHEVLFRRSDSPGRVVFRIGQAGVPLASFSISPGRTYPKVAVFVRETSGSPAAVRIYLLPATGAPVAQRTFFRADRCALSWSPNGRHLLALASTEVDSSGTSYYGETALYFMAGDGTLACRVDLSACAGAAGDQQPPVHDYAWSPDSSQFAVLYGFMPKGHAAVFDTRCELVYAFPPGPRNHVRWNPRGDVVCLAGFGNLAGNVEIWAAPSDGKAFRMLGKCQAQGSASCEWSPCGTVLATATLTPRLRVDNGVRLWTWRGESLGSFQYAELYAVHWRPDASATQGASLDIDAALALPSDGPSSSAPGSSNTTASAATTGPSGAYRPPGLRGSSNFQSSFAAVRPAVKQSAAPAQDALHVPLGAQEKVVKKLRQKLEQIERLKAQAASGATLELNQQEKLRTEDSVRAELLAAEALLPPQSVLRTSN